MFFGVDVNVLVGFQVLMTGNPKEKKMTEQYRSVRESVRGQLESRTKLHYVLGYLYDFVFHVVRKQRAYVLSGLEKNTGKAMTTLFVGAEDAAHQFCSIVYSESYEALPAGEILTAKMELMEEYSKAHANLLIVRSKAPTVLKFQKRGYFVLPTLSFRLDLRFSIDDLLRRMSHRRRRDIGKIEDLGYSYSICREDCESFDYFYQDMYRPFAEQRFGKAATLKSYLHLKTVYQRNGGIIFVQKDEKTIAGILFQKRKNGYSL